jgi:hypothetical protein
MALTRRRVSELGERPIDRIRLCVCVLAGLVEFFVPATRSDGIHHVRVGRGDKTRALYLRANRVDVYTFYATFIKGPTTRLGCVSGE